MLGWLLRGRAHLTPGEFRNRNHKHVFVNAFVLLDLLQPLIFQDSQVSHQGVVIPYTAVVTVKTGVKKWSRNQAVFLVSVKRSKTSFKLS